MENGFPPHKTEIPFFQLSNYSIGGSGKLYSEKGISLRINYGTKLHIRENYLISLPTPGWVYMEFSNAEAPSWTGVTPSYIFKCNFLGREKCTAITSTAGEELLLQQAVNVSKRGFLEKIIDRLLGAGIVWDIN